MVLFELADMGMNGWNLFFLSSIMFIPSLYFSDFIISEYNSTLLCSKQKLLDGHKFKSWSLPNTVRQMQPFGRKADGLNNIAFFTTKLSGLKCFSSSSPHPKGLPSLQSFMSFIFPSLQLYHGISSAICLDLPQKLKCHILGK